MYNLLGRESYSGGQVTRALVDAMEQGRFSWQMLYNAFESVAFDVFPGLDGVMRDMEAYRRSTRQPFRKRACPLYPGR